MAGKGKELFTGVKIKNCTCIVCHICNISFLSCDQKGQRSNTGFPGVKSAKMLNFEQREKIENGRMAKPFQNPIVLHI